MESCDVSLPTPVFPYDFDWGYAEKSFVTLATVLGSTQVGSTLGCK